MITAEIRVTDNLADGLEQAFAANPAIPLDTIHLRFDGSCLVLLGTVASIDEKAAIYETIDDFAIVRDIDDRLQLVTQEPPMLARAA
jgi:hypothetical protein